EDPDWRRLPAATPEGIRRLLRRCLQKDERLRFRDMRDVRIEIEETQGGADTDALIVQGISRRKKRIAWLSALALVVLIAAATIGLIARRVPPAPEMRLDITTPATTSPASLAISPDGQKIAFAAISEGRPRLWVRSLDSVAAKP